MRTDPMLTTLEMLRVWPGSLTAPNSGSILAVLVFLLRPVLYQIYKGTFPPGATTRYGREEANALGRQ